MKDDEILKQYLLGTLDEEQADDLEQRLLQEGDLFELAEAVEGDLLAAAVRGELSPAERGRVLRRLASSPRGRARLALIRDLVSLRREPVPVEVLVFRLLERPVFRAAAVAASLTFAACGLWLGSQKAQPGLLASISPPIHEHKARTPNPPPAPPTTDQMAQQAPAPAPPTSPKKEAQPEPSLWILQLALSTMRGPGDELRPQAIPHGTRRVEIRLPLLPGEPSTSFVAILRNALTEDEIWRAERLVAQDVDGQKMVILSPPMADLAPGSYEIELRGDGNELVGNPTFEIATH